jgi:NAD-dependent DNA ligase
MKRFLHDFRQRQEIEQKMDELAREYHHTHDPEIPEEIYELVRRLGEMEH